jgi:hypothetical protein
MEWGRDHDEIRDYIEEYRRENNWVIEKGSKKKTFKIPYSVILVVLLAVSVGAGISARMIQSNGGKKEYQSALVQVDNQPDMDNKIKILEDYIDSNPQSDFTVAALTKIEDIRLRIEDRDYTSAVRNAEKWIQTNNFDKAKEIYSHYLARYPNGSHQYKVNTLISDMSDKHYIYLKRNLTSLQEQKDWEKCIHLCSGYLSTYNNNKYSRELQRMQGVFQKNLQDKTILANLIENAKAAGTDYKSTKKIFLDYLEGHFDSSLTEAIQHELTRLEKLERQKRRQQIRDKIKALIEQTDGRFVEKEKGIISDTRTGLMWTLMDSKSDLNECLTYTSAKKYVNDLETGDYSDWRLPSAKELAEIYKNEPFFPSWDRKWFWTSHHYKRYWEGWRISVDIVTSQKETSWRKEQADSFECGAVHAVRP